MRTVFVFPTCEWELIATQLDALSPNQSQPWIVEDSLYVNRDSTSLESDFRELMPALTAALGAQPTWMVSIDVSGRIDGAAEVRRLVSILLRHGGVAMDDYSPHLYTAGEV